jgi:hypothetical protein
MISISAIKVVDSLIVLIGRYATVSSAKHIREHWVVTRNKSFMNRENNIGPKMEPWGTQNNIANKSEFPKDIRRFEK